MMFNFRNFFSKIFSFRILILLTICAAVFRILACQWGLPFFLHPDEHIVANKAIKMIQDGTFSPPIFNRPNHFDIKMSALLYYLCAFVKDIPIDTFITEYRPTCYYISRLFVAFCGTLLVPVLYAIAECIKSKSGIYAAFFAAFLPLFVQHSVYATPDIPLTLAFALFTLMTTKYLKSHSDIHLLWMCFFGGLGVTIKYPAAIMTFPVAITVLLVSIKERSWKKFIRHSLLSFFGSLLAVYLISPTLILDFPKVIEALRLESRSEHLGSDGLDFMGNLTYYANNFLESAGIEFVVFLCIGLYFIIRSKNIISISALFGWIFILCMSSLPLHWERWVLPGLISHLLVAAIGIAYAGECLKKYSFYKLLQYALCLIIFTNFFIGSLVVVKRSLAPQSVLVAKEFCDKHNITTKNSEFEGYTPLFITFPKYLGIPVDDGKLVLQDNVEYIILSKKMYGRFYAERERYSKLIERYELIKKMKRIARFRDYNFRPSIVGVKKIYRMYRYLKNWHKRRNLSVGDTILIYKRGVI